MRLFALLLVFLCAASASAQELRERYDYEVTWGYADVARVTLQRGCPTNGYVPASLSAESLGVAEQVHAFQIKLDSFVEPAGRTLEGRTFIEEDQTPRRYRTRFAANGAAVTHKTHRNKDTTVHLTLRPGTHDLLSWFFALRDLDLAKGSVHTFYVWDGWKLARVSANVGEIERIWTPQGTFDARRVALTRVRLHHAPRARAYQTRSGSEHLGTVWLTNDKPRRPVAMDFRAPVGMAKLRLAAHRAVSCR